MSSRILTVSIALALLLAALSAASAQNRSPVMVPEGTTVSAIKVEDSDSALTLKPEEQVAFLFVHGIWNLEQQCLDNDMGIGRLAALGELVRGVKTPGGVIGLSTTPTKDTNYNYSLQLIGSDCVIMASPRVKGIGGFALVGSPKRMNGSFYYNPKGGDMLSPLKLTEYGYGGNGFTHRLGE